MNGSSGQEKQVFSSPRMTQRGIGDVFISVVKHHMENLEKLMKSAMIAD